LNKNISKAKWKQLKGKIKERWGKLTNDEMDIMGGEIDQLIGKIEEKYQITRKDAEKEVAEWYRVHIGHTRQKTKPGGDKESLVHKLQKL